jgi:murein DD-endopeptidase MepM/ murein hydrolase activator NlpD
VPWYKISRERNKIPNAWRPYRKSYTDGIHHGWDIVAPIWTPVVALDNSKIVRIVKWFKYNDLGKIKKWNYLTLEDELSNLDTLRWNQVWIKTSKWDVVFYSHLSFVNDKIRVWDIVSKWTMLWKVWKSGVPDRKYKNIHLHFSIQKAPRLKNKFWNYTFMDYMKWDWYFKWKSLDYVSKHSFDIFEK